MSIFIALVACPSKEVASSLAKLLVDSELAACVQVLPGMQSVYRWQGSICIDEEALLIIKSSSNLMSEVKRCVEDNHPYEVPEFICLTASDVSARYEQWLLENVKGISTP